MKILILYHSGSGSTRTICQILAERISRDTAVDIQEISTDFNYSKISNYKLLILGLPTYHCRPPQSILDFIENMPPFETKIKSYLIATCGLYLGNTMRIAVKNLLKKNIITCGYMRIRGPGSDELIYSVPSWINFFFRYEKKVSIKIKKISDTIYHLLKNENTKLKKPPFQWYAPINDLFRFFGEKNYERYKKNIHILKDRCINCSYCVKNCIRNCFDAGDENPVYDFTNCEFCLKCIHNCPTEAISFSEEMINRPRLNKEFYNNLKDSI